MRAAGRQIRSRQAGQHGLKQHQAQPDPAISEPRKIESLGVEQMQEAVICLPEIGAGSAAGWP